MAFLFSLNAWAGDPKLEFRTIETEHFQIHYHQGLEDLARRAAPIFEEVHQDLTLLFDWEVDGPTHVVITDSTDRANGSAHSTRYPLIRLFATAPTSDSSLQYHDHWIRTLFVHEYTHVISLRIQSGIAKFINAIFGDVYLPNTLSPRWYHEGISVLNETYETSSGRIRSPYFPMFVRTDVLEGEFLTLGEASNYTRGYPRGTGHYVYGAMFMDYLRTRFGMEKVVEIYHVYGSKLLPYGMNRAFKEVFGTDLVTLYEQWTEQVKADVEHLKGELEKQGLTSSTRITFDGETKGRPIFSPDDKSVLMAIGNGMENPGIFRVPLKGGGNEILALSNSNSPLSMDRSGRLFFTRTAPYGLYYRFNDVFALDRPDMDPRRITVGARSWDAAISPKGDLMAMAVTDVGNSELLLADERGNVIRTLVESNPMNQVYAPSWSPDGRTIAAVVRRGPQVDVVLIDVETGEETLVTDDVAIEDTPVFHPGGRYLLYKSGRSGVDNIYAYELDDGGVYQVTNVLTGAYYPAVSHDGKTLAFIKYSSVGYDLHITPLDLESARRVNPIKESYREVRPVPEPSKAETKPYNPLPSFTPKYWNINALMDTTGGMIIEASTAMYDATQRHLAGAVIDYGISNSAFSGAFAYAYYGLGPGFHVGMSRTASPRNTGYTVDGESRNWVQEITSGNLNLSFPIPGLDRSHSLTVGYDIIHAKPREEPILSTDPALDQPQAPTQYFRAGLSFDWAFNDTVTSPLGISPHKGRRVASGISFYHPYLGGKQTLASFAYGWTEYFSMPWLKYHVAAFRLGGRVFVSSPPKQAGMAIGGYGEQNIVNVILNDSQAGLPGLRGYPNGAFEGDKYHSLRLEYRFPVWFVEAAYATIPVFLRRIQAGIFSDNAVISYDPLDRDDWRSSLGVELVWHITLQYFQHLTLRTGYAHGFMEGGVNEFIFIFGQGF